MVRIVFATFFASAGVLLLLASCGSSEPVVEPANAQDPATENEYTGRNIAAPPADGNRKPAGKLVAPTGARNEFSSSVPPSKFQTTDGQPTDLATATADQGAVVVFYRGHWCKQCRKQLAELEEARGEIEGRGFEIYAVSTDAPEASKELAKRLNLGYALLSDKVGMAIQAWGVYTAEHDLARPAVFVIAPGGEISYRYVSDSPADRPAVADILAEIDKARAPEPGAESEAP